MKKIYKQNFLMLLDEKIAELEEKHEYARKKKKFYKYLELRLEKIKNDIEYYIELRSEVFNNKT